MVSVYGALAVSQALMGKAQVCIPWGTLTAAVVP
jgi:hypothetical protein